MLRGIFEPKKDNMIGGRRKLLHNVRYSPSMIRIMLSRKMRRAGRVACLGRRECMYDFGGKARMKGTTRKD
jgi:hypothetical protein